MDLQLRSKVVLITGGTKGIGLACARAFLDEGARVAISSRSPVNIEAARQALGDVFTFPADLCHSDQALALVEQTEQALGPIDILVNSAGAALRTPPAELTPAHWVRAMDAKFFSYINVIDPLIKRMAERGSGVVVNVIGNGGKLATPTHLAGGAANAALMLATAGLASAYAGQGVRVVGINPGLIDTERVTQGFAADARMSGAEPESIRAKRIGRIPLGRMGTAAEIANAVVFLASGAASYITGVNISMDGGSTPIVI